MVQTDSIEVFMILMSPTAHLRDILRRLMKNHLSKKLEKVIRTAQDPPKCLKIIQLMLAIKIYLKIRVTIWQEETLIRLYAKMITKVP